jgi:hypothetical protein
MFKPKGGGVGEQWVGIHAQLLPQLAEGGSTRRHQMCGSFPLPRLLVILAGLRDILIG